MKNKKIIFIFILVLILLVIDQGTKICAIDKNIDLISNLVSIHYEKSITGSFGVGNKGTTTFIITNIVVIGIILKFIKTQSEQIDKKTYVALGMIIAGALGNLIDRIFRGFVIKFIKIMNLPTFNISDMLIILGYILLAVFFAIYAYDVRKTNKKTINKEKE